MAFLVVVLYSKHMHIFTAPINASLKRQPIALGALGTTPDLEKLMREAPAGSPLRYVCVLAYVDPERQLERVFFGECRGRLAAERRGTRGFGYDPAFIPEEDGKHRTMAELEDREKDEISHRGRAVRAFGEWLTSELR